MSKKIINFFLLSALLWRKLKIFIFYSEPRWYSSLTIKNDICFFRLAARRKHWLRVNQIRLVDSRDKVSANEMTNRNFLFDIELFCICYYRDGDKIRLVYHNFLLSIVQICRVICLSSKYDQAIRCLADRMSLFLFNPAVLKVDVFLAGFHF